jgi:hypothetical protein
MFHLNLLSIELLFFFFIGRGRTPTYPKDTYTPIFLRITFFVVGARDVATSATDRRKISTDVEV